MQVGGVPMRTIWWEDGTVAVIDQTRLPHRFEIVRLAGLEEAARAIETMVVRGAPLLGATAAFAIALALRADPDSLDRAVARLAATRPTAIDLHRALRRVADAVGPLPPRQRAEAALECADRICDESVAACSAIGDHGLPLIRAIRREHRRPVQVLTHCNAGWLATVDWGTATAPVYKAHDAGIPVHVWVTETRPRSQGALTAWELANHGVRCTVVADNAAGHLMQRGEVDLCIVGSDRTTATGDVANKIGTYLEAAAAADSGVPFYAALPSSSVDWDLDDGIAGIPIEERSPDEVTHAAGAGPDGDVVGVRLIPEGAAAFNPAFDVTPARLVTGLITERGVCEASRAGLASLFPDRAGEARKR
jgi:methylthioribose-1-phosphate isomerase